MCTCICVQVWIHMHVYVCKCGLKLRCVVSINMSLREFLSTKHIGTCCICMYVCIYTCLCIYLYICIYIYTYTYVYVYIYTIQYISINVCINTIHVYIHMYIFSIYVRMYVSIYINIFGYVSISTNIFEHLYVCTYIYVCICAYMHVYTYTRIYSYIYIEVQKRTFACEYVHLKIDGISVFSNVWHIFGANTYIYILYVFRIYTHTQNEWPWVRWPYRSKTIRGPQHHHHHTTRMHTYTRYTHIYILTHPTLWIMYKYLRASPSDLPFGSWYITGTNRFHLIISIRWKLMTQPCCVIQKVHWFDTPLNSCIFVLSEK